MRITNHLSSPVRRLSYGVIVAAVVSTGSLAAPQLAAGAQRGSGHVTYQRVGQRTSPPGRERAVRPVAASRAISGAVALEPRDPAALSAALAEVADPHSPNYKHYLAPGQFGQQFGATAGTIHAVESSLRGSGLTVTSVSRNGLLVNFHGQAATVESAFRTGLLSYRLADGKSGMRATKAPALPSSIAGDVTAVTGLNRAPVGLRPMYERETKPTAMSGSAPKVVQHYPGAPSPCSAAIQTAQSEDGLTLDQIAKSYGLQGLYKNGDLGAGTSIDIFELGPYVKHDVSKFDQCYFGKTAATSMISRLHYIQTGSGGGTGYSSIITVEADLDVEFASALAPQATINVYSGSLANSDAGDSTATIDDIVNADNASVVSFSYGECEADVQTEAQDGTLNVENELFEQAALQGQTVLASSADNGADTCSNDSGAPVAPDLSVSDPASQPYVTAVGGTTITDDTSTRPTEHVWNGGSLGGSTGGGVSAVWGAPSWQLPQFSTADQASLTQAYTDGAPKCPNVADGGSCREVPDIAAQGDPNTGAPAEYDADDGGWFDIGGTSVSAPLWAAMLDLINDSPACKATSPVGFASPALYSVADNPTEDAASFNDVTQGNNDIFDLSGGKDFSAGVGYDMASGLGTPEVTSPDGSPALDAYLCASAPSTQPVISSLNPTTEQVGAEKPLTITGTNLSDVSSLTIGSYDVPSSDYTLVSDTEIDVDAIPASKQLGGDATSLDGSGRALVSVTDSSGSTSPISDAADLTYVDTSATGDAPSVSEVLLTGGPDAGGNTVHIVGANFDATGIDATSDVTFGGVPATSFTVLSSTELSAVVPAYTSGTTNCATGTYATTDVCQTQVVVSNVNGSSATQPILKPDNAGSVTCTPGTDCEVYPATTEYDFFPPPTVTNVSPSYISEQGTSVVTVTGTGFDTLGLNWVTLGKIGPAKNRDYSIDYTMLSPTQLEVSAFPMAETTTAVAVPLTVSTLGGTSNATTVNYAGVPNLSSVTPPAGSTNGGTSIALTGSGFSGADPADGGAITYTLFGEYVQPQENGYTVNSDTSISAVTPASLPADETVSVCTVTGCSVPPENDPTADDFVFFVPGDPAVNSVSPATGPASGGNVVTITGANLGNVVDVSFGKTPATEFSNVAPSSFAYRYEIQALVPPGKAGTTVDIQVTTVESLYGGNPSAITTADQYTYQVSAPSAPTHVTSGVKRTTAHVSWKAPLSSGGKPVTKYKVQASPTANQHGSATPPKPVTVKTGAGATSATLKGLDPGWSYRITVKAGNAIGYSSAASTGKVYQAYS